MEEEKKLSYRDCLLQNLSQSGGTDTEKRSETLLVKKTIATEETDDDCYLPIPHRKVGPKLPVNKFPTLDAELNKVRALCSFKNNIIEHIIRYFKKHKIYHGGKLKYIRTQMYNHFPNWFFKLNIDGKVKDFIPQGPLDIQTNLDYIFKENQIEKVENFDPKLLTFNPRYLKDDLQVSEIVKNDKNNFVRLYLKTNAEDWKLLPITREQMANLKVRYRGPDGKFEEYLAILLLRYCFLGGVNNHLSIPLEIYQKMQVEMELFGSPFNVLTPKYCSPFPDIEQYFGSSGSVFHYKLEDNRVYGANPPYDVKIVEDMAEKIEKELVGLKNVTIYVTIPLWRESFPAHDILKKSRFLRDTCELNREEYPFFHYFKGRLIPASHIYLMVLSTQEKGFLSCEDIKRAWPKPDKKYRKLDF